MKIVGLLLVAILTGTAVGICTSLASFRTAHGRLTAPVIFGVAPDRLQPAKSSPDGFGSVEPKIVVDAEDFDFGTMENGEHSEHPFLIANDGGSPLEIELLKISCSCTSSDLTQGKKITIKPGETFQITLDWYANASDGHFRQAATLGTNDPLRPQVYLSITGKVVKGVITDPPGFMLTGISVGQTAEREIHVLSYRDENFKILGYEFMGGATPELYDLTISPLDTAEYSKPGLRAGYTAKLTIKPGLPVGNVSQLVKIKTNDKRKPELMIGIVGVIDGPISISGPRWNPTTNVLRIGAVNRVEGYKAMLLLKILDVDPELLNPTVTSVYPSALKVSFGEQRVIKTSERTVVTYPLSIEVPPNGPVLANVGSKEGPLGEIEIDTGDAKTGKVRMRVEVITVDQ